MKDTEQRAREILDRLARDAAPFGISIQDEIDARREAESRPPWHPTPRDGGSEVTP